MARTDPRNRSQFRMAPGLSGVSALTADFTTHEFAAHAHDTFVFAATEAGGSTFRTRSGAEQTRIGALLVFNPEEAHSSRQDERGRWRYRGLYVAGALVHEVADELGFADLPMVGRNQLDDAGLVAAFVQAHRACNDTDGLRAGEAVRGALARLLADHCGGRVSPPRPDNSRIGRVIDYVRIHYAEDLTLEDLARQIDLSPFQLCRSFRRALGVPPYGYVTQIRLRAAAQLIREGLAMAEAATTVGFYDQAAMNRHFKRTHGFTPSQLLTAAS